jgi:hypothetical protein
MAKPALNGPGVVACVGQGVALGGMSLELQAGGGRGALDHAGKAGRDEGRSAPLTKTKGEVGLSR